jgi:SAM-dependent methyltransferase
MSRRRRLVVAGGIAVGVAAGISAAIRHGHRPMGREVPGGILMRDTRSYDSLAHGWLLRRFYERIARDIAAATLPGAHLLDVGYGPGRLAILLAQRDLHVTGVDLDPAMIERATANAARIPDTGRRPSFTAADVAWVSLADESQDVVVTMLSMHHWSDPRRACGDRPRPAARGKGAGVGPPPRHGAAAPPRARPRRTGAHSSAPRGRSDPVALALAVPPDAPDRARQEVAG